MKLALALQSLCFWLLLCALSVSSLGFFGHQYFQLDLLANFRLVYLAAALVALLFALVLLLGKAKLLTPLRLISLSLLLASSNLLWFSQIWSYKSNIHQANDSPSLTVFHANLLSQNRQTQALMALIKNQQPDIIGLQEVNARWLSHFKNELSILYPHVLAIPRKDNFGILLAAKKPFINIKQIQTGPYSTPTIQAQIKVDEKVIQLLYSHPVPPINKRFFQKRNQQLQELAKLSRLSKNTLLFGDFNSSFGSPLYLKLLKESALTSASAPFSRTWPSSLPILGIDHILHSPSLKLINFEVLQDIGSDHLPIMAKFSI